MCASPGGFFAAGLLTLASLSQITTELSSSETLKKSHTTDAMFSVLANEETINYIKAAVEGVGIPKVLSVLESEITRLLDKQGTYLFDIYEPEVLPRDNYVLVQMDFGFPHHLLVEFLRRTLQQAD